MNNGFSDDADRRRSRPRRRARNQREATESRHDKTYEAKEKRLQNSSAFAAELEADVFKKLSDSEQHNLRKMMQKLKIDTRDIEFFRILLIFEEYRHCFESLPSKLNEHREKVEEHAEKVKILAERTQERTDVIEDFWHSVRKFGEETEDRSKKLDVNAGEMVEKIAETFDRGMRDVRGMTKKAFRDINESADEALLDMRDKINATINNIAVNIEDTFPEDIQKGLRLGDMDELNAAFAAALSARTKALELLKADTQALKDELEMVNFARQSYRKDVRATQWANWRWASIAMASIILCLWIFFHFHYSTKLDQEVEYLNAQNAENRTVLDALARAGRRLEITNGEKGTKRLFMYDAQGWNTTDKRGVLEFKEKQ